MANQNNAKSTVQVFFGADERFTPYLAVAIHSLIANVNPAREYALHILHADIKRETQEKIASMAIKNVSIEFNDVTDSVAGIVSHLPVRDYYSASTYYRFVIARDFPKIDKALYIDADTCVVADIAKLYDIQLGDKLVAAVPEAVMAAKDPAGRYAEKFLGVNRHRYFNAGVMLINSKLWREEDVLGQFVGLSHFVECKVAQDQDYLNLICKDRVRYVHRRWNMETTQPYDGINKNNRGIIHYAFAAKPWADVTCVYSNIFWKYASASPFYMEIKSKFAAVTNEQLEASRAIGESVFALCESEIKSDHNFLRLAKKKKTKRTFEEEFGEILDSIFMQACPLKA